nr:DUF488 family protein [Verminephrobacter eiseniae]
MIKLYTIGFTEKSAEKFFNLLRDSEVKKIVDTRINNTSQISGFAKGTDLKYFAREIGKMAYEHNVDYAPTKEMLSSYRDKKLTWEQYETQYLNLLDMRKIAQKLILIHCMKIVCCAANTPLKDAIGDFWPNI